MPARVLDTGFILGIGASCFISVYDSETVLKDYEIWVNGKRQSYRSQPCEDSVSWEELVYKHLGSHPNILLCYWLVEVRPSVHSLRLELAPLGNVRQYIEDHPEPLPEHTRLRMALDVSVGLGHIHSRKVQHADLSCRNLFLFEGFRVKLGDFGDASVEALYAREDFPNTDSITVGYIIMNCWKEVYDNADQVVEALETATYRDSVAAPLPSK